MLEDHDFLERNYLLYEACRNQFNIKESDINILNEFNIRQSIVDLKPQNNDNSERCPYWLIKWVSLICRYVKYEHQLLV
jgi:hypothetical protein